MANRHERTSEALGVQRARVAEQVVALLSARHPEVEQLYGKAGRDRCLQEVGRLIDCLAQAIGSDKVELLTDYLCWAKIRLVTHGAPDRDLADLLGWMKEALHQELAPELSLLACEYVNAGLRRIPSLPTAVPSLIDEDTPLGPEARRYLEALLEGEPHIASKLVHQMVQQGIAIGDIYLLVFQRVLREVGRLWQENQLRCVQEQYCTSVTRLILSDLEGRVAPGGTTQGVLVAAGVAGDRHELGIRMVCDFFAIAGWDTHYVGVGATAATVIDALVRFRATVLAVSATLAYQVGAVATLIAAVRQTPECRDVQVIVGGHPFRVAPNLWKTVGANGTADDARQAIVVAERLTDRPLQSAISDERDPLRALPAGAAMEQNEAAHGQRPQADDLHGELSRTRGELADLQRELGRKNSELIVSQQRLRASENRYVSLSTCSPLGILETDTAGRCLYTNPQWQALTGLTSNESLGDGWQRTLTFRDEPTLVGDWLLAFEAGQDFNREFQLATTRGSARWARARSRAIRSEKGEISGYLSTLEDITERRQADMAVEQVEKELLEVSRRAGLTEATTSVLNKVGNVLDGVNAAATSAVETIRKSKVASLARMAALLREHEADLAAFVANDSKGKQLPGYLDQLARHLAAEQGSALEELVRIKDQIERIRVIVDRQQTRARVSGITGPRPARNIAEDVSR